MLRRTALSSLLFGLIWHLTTGAILANEARSVAYDARRVLGVPLHVITVNLNDPHIKVSVATADGFPRGHEPFGDFVSRVAPTAAITGTYFHNSSFYPVGDIIVDGRMRNHGRVGTLLRITPYNEVTFAPWSREASAHGGQYETVLGAGPRLLVDGGVAVRARAEGFRDPHVLGRAPRTAVGLTVHNKLLLVAVRQALTLTELAKVMRAMGCVHAMNLDGGSSSALYFQGEAMVSPQRPLVNLLVVHEDVPLLARTVPPLTPKDRSKLQSWIGAKAAVHYSAGGRLSARGAHAEAGKHYATAAYIAGSNASYYASLGTALEAWGDDPAAAKACATAGHILVRKEEYHRALAPLTKALELNPLEVSAYDDLAVAFGRVYGKRAGTQAISEPMRLEREWKIAGADALQQAGAEIASARLRQVATTSSELDAKAIALDGREEPQHQAPTALWNELYVHVMAEADEILTRERPPIA
jgi:tetratricopeptide (TPR) repeat protein